MTSKNLEEPPTTKELLEQLNNLQYLYNSLEAEYINLQTDNQLLKEKYLVPQKIQILYSKILLLPIVYSRPKNFLE